MIRRHLFLVLCAFLLCFTVQADESPVSISVYPSVSSAPATFRVRVFTPKHDGNRRVKWCYDDPATELKCSQEELDGAKAAYSRTVWFKGVGCGSFVAWAELTRVEGEKERRLLSAQTPFRVIGVGEGCNSPERDY